MDWFKEKFKPKLDASGIRYKNGNKRCQQCDILINTDGEQNEYKCPCCKQRLRTKSRQKHAQRLVIAPVLR